MKKILLIIMAQLLVITNTAIAQKEKNPARKVELSFVCVSTLPGQNAIKTFEGGVVKLSKRHPSKKVKLKTDEAGACKIYLENEVITPESIPIGKIKMPLAVDKGMVLLIPKNNNKEYHTLFFSDQAFAFGKLSLLNMTNIPITVKTKDKTIRVAPRIPKVYAPNIRNRAFVTPVKMARLQKGNKWKMFYSSTWRIQKTRKELLILYIHPVSKRIRTKSILEHKRANN